ncbi:heavy metal translocating P-type ATPase [Psychrobacter sp. I-STPA10]|uniref:heavy metal translocating P-type ATPase n=1 Tax=Psychrobacter sp. I-STPA10 TaxID=2585769 RepID=UPI001E4B3272|nr:cation-translocating P-type ATPase [Psychrobacter sp. I-STPA10]
MTSDTGKEVTDTSQAKSAHLQLFIEDMSCQACATRIEKVLNKKPAIEQASVNFAGETASVDYDKSQTNTDEIIAWIEKTGFRATEQQSDSLFAQQPEDKIDKRPPWQLIALWVCLLPFLIGMAGMLLGQGMVWMPPLWIQFVLSTIVQFGLAIPFYQSAWSSIKGRLANMDVLVVIGTLTIWAYSTYSWLTHDGLAIFSQGIQWQHLLHHAGDMHTAPVYFEAGVMIIAFVRLGKYLEHRTKKQSLNSINLLLQLTPEKVERQVAAQHQDYDDQTQSETAANFELVDLSKVQRGDVLRAKQGSRVATDGIVVAGEGWCDESHLTGEFLPLSKKVGDNVLAGALVADGSLVYKVQATGSQTQLGDMVLALSEAQGSKANLARLADKVAAIFVPVVVSIAIITFALTYWFTGQMDRSILHAVSVLVIACPCALGLATPAAIMAGMGVAARHGVWFKDAQSLEAAGSVDTVVFDKTGTLTQGQPVIITHMMVSNQINWQEVLQLAASVEVHASHPLATTLVEAAKSEQLSLFAAKNVEVVQGQGIQAQISGYGLVKVGTPEFTGLSLPKHLPKAWQIASTVAVSVDDVPLGAFALADEIKADAKQTVQHLHDAGYQVILMSGDKQSVVDYIANALDIHVAYGSMSPRDKAADISQLQQQGRRVVMVGDGVNDAPAMATATASFAMSEGSDAAKHSASARLLGHSLDHVLEAQNIAKATIKNIKQNLFFAFIYNCIGIPLAAFGFLNPMIAAAAMAMSSLSVLFNALRLTRYHCQYQNQTDTN